MSRMVLVGAYVRAERIIQSPRHGKSECPKRPVKRLEETVNEKTEKALAKTENIFAARRTGHPAFRRAVRPPRFAARTMGHPAFRRTVRPPPPIDRDLRPCCAKMGHTAIPSAGPRRDGAPKRLDDHEQGKKTDPGQPMQVR